MKTVKNIFISLFLTFGVLCYFGHGFVDYYGHVKSDIENTHRNSGSHNIVTSEHSMEEEVSFVFPKNSVHIINSGSEILFTATFTSPFQLVYTIWLPPKVS
jgi:hypothetical protein